MLVDAAVIDVSYTVAMLSQVQNKAITFCNAPLVLNCRTSKCALLLQRISEVQASYVVNLAEVGKDDEYHGVVYYGTVALVKQGYKSNYAVQTVLSAEDNLTNIKAAFIESTIVSVLNKLVTLSGRTLTLPMVRCDDGKQMLDCFQLSEKADTELSTLKVGYNNYKTNQCYPTILQTGI